MILQKSFYYADYAQEAFLIIIKTVVILNIFVFCILSLFDK